VVNMEWDKIWAFNKKVQFEIKFYGLNAVNAVILIITFTPSLFEDHSALLQQHK